MWICLNIVKFYHISWVAIIRGGNWLDEKFSRWEFPGRELSGWQFFGWDFSWVGIFRVRVFLGGNCPGGTCLGWEFSLVEVFRVGIVQWESSGLEFSEWEFSCYWITYWIVIRLSYWIISEKQTGQIIQEWTKWNLWKIFFEKLKVIWSA